MNRQHVLAVGVIASSTVGAAEERTLEALMAGWGTDLNAIELSAETLEPGLHVIRGAGGAAIASIGRDGVLLVDDQFAASVPLLEQQIEALGGSGVDFVINTHWHFDHADGNPALGADGARIVAHEKSRAQMLERTKVEYAGYYYMQPPYPLAGLPEITFDDAMTLHFNGQRVDVVHFGPAHTAGDAIVFFQRDNVVHVGDLYSAGYPYLDTPNGGSLAGLIAVNRRLLERIDADTRIVSGHSPVAALPDLEAYVEMLEATQAEITRHIRAGHTLEQILEAAVTAPFDAERGNPTLFVTMAYRSLAQ